MKFLFPQVTVVDNQSPYNNQKVNLLVEDDTIIAIGEDVADAKAKVIDVAGSHVSVGWVELHSNFGDPGFEDREDLQSGTKAAAAGGFTGVALSPATQPVVQTKADIEYLLKRTEDGPVNIYPLGALSKDLKGQELSEMYDMHRAGALGFYNDKHPLNNANLLKLSLLYTKEFAPVFVHPRQQDLTLGGQMHEGHISTYLGLKGIPAFAEELMIARDLFVANYAETAIHFAGISTAGAVDLIREAKNKGQKVTADVNFYNIVFTDDVLSQYDTNFKVNPPIRTQEDVNALLQGLKDGTIDAIAADHIPHNVEHKQCEFDLASFGMAAIEHVFSALHPVIGKIGLHTTIEKLTAGPRYILQLPALRIAEGNIAELTFFKPEQNYTASAKSVFSRAANNPFKGLELTGQVVGIFNKQKFTSSSI